MNSKTIVFTGPTLSKSDVQSLCDFDVSGPAKCGDIINAVSKGYDQIFLIDGVYENCAAVWHKEILLAIEKGCRVFGSSSMGALRASELDSYGMVGVGEIYELYRSGLINKDDYVAVAHLPNYPYTKINEPFVDIYFTLKWHYEKNLITHLEYEELVELSKNKFYPERYLLSQLNESSIEDERKEEIIKMIYTNDGFIYQKKNDAIEMLTNFNMYRCKGKLESVRNSIFLRNLRNFIITDVGEENCNSALLSRISLCSHILNQLGFCYDSDGNNLVAVLETNCNSIIEKSTYLRGKKEKLLYYFMLTTWKNNSREVRLLSMLYTVLISSFEERNINKLSNRYCIKIFREKAKLHTAESFKKFLSSVEMEDPEFFSILVDLYTVIDVIETDPERTLNLDLSCDLHSWNNEVVDYLNVK